MSSHSGHIFAALLRLPGGNSLMEEALYAADAAKIEGRGARNKLRRHWQLSVALRCDLSSAQSARTMSKPKLTTCWHPDDGRIYLCPICNKGGWRTRAKTSLREHLMLVVSSSGRSMSTTPHAGTPLLLAMVLAGGIWAANRTSCVLRE